MKWHLDTTTLVKELQPGRGARPESHSSALLPPSFQSCTWGAYFHGLFLVFRRRICKFLKSKARKTSYFNLGFYFALSFKGKAVIYKV